MHKTYRLIILFAILSTAVFFVWQYYIEEGRLPYRFSTTTRPPIYVTKGPVVSVNFYSKDYTAVWRKKIFSGEVFYFIDKTKGDGVLHALSRRSCSGLYYKLKFDPKASPMVNWKWQVIKFPDKSNNKDCDDYAARIYVIFPALFFPNSKALEYVWDESKPRGSILSNKFTKNIKIIIVRSGRDSIGELVCEERNVYEDYKLAFGRYPDSSVGAVAIMTDSDESKSVAEALYGDMAIGYQKHK